ncbi:MAG: site-specific integrase [Flavobacteriales bacterium]|jgi:integrase|nr:site-specific integrase [Flavobacteriales bacterium]
MAIKVTLRLKPIKDGRLSLYLDFYPAIFNPKTNKKTRREFLRMYVLEKPKNRKDKKHKSEMLYIAEGIRQKRENELNKPEIYTEYEKGLLKKNELGKTNFLEYFYKMVESREGKTRDSWYASYKYLNDFTNGEILFNQLSISFFENFKQYLLSCDSRNVIGKKLSKNTASSYFKKVKACLKQAYKDDYLATDLNSQIAPIKEEESIREYLSIEELNRLVKTPCKNEVIKKMALFSALTGLRFSDINKLKWSEVRVENSEYKIVFTQKKTKENEFHPISEQAYELLGDRLDGSMNVFEEIKYSAYNNKHLKQWVIDAGIRKKISFHNFRHTYATLLLESGTDLYTVSKMLGHKNVKTTQIYAKVVDSLKKQTVDRIKLNFEDE